MFASTIAIINSIDEPNLPSRLGALQRWLIYWAVLGCATIVENTLSFITFVPGYSLLKIVFHVWLIIPMVTENEDWKKSGAPWLFFEFIKPQFEANKDAVKKFVSNPLDLKTVLKLSSLAKKEESATDNNPAAAAAATTTGYDYAAILDGSIFMVRNIFTREVTEKAVDSPNTEEYDMVDKPEATEAYQKKSYFW